MRVIFARVCEKAGVQLVEIDGEGDHVHLLVHYQPTVSSHSKVIENLLPTFAKISSTVSFICW
jgi:REP element-mobilizing transposase RayT